MRDKRTPKDVCGEAIDKQYPNKSNEQKKKELFRYLFVFLTIYFKYFFKVNFDELRV